MKTNSFISKTVNGTSRLLKLSAAFLFAITCLACTDVHATTEYRNTNNFYGVILKTDAQVVLTQGTEPSIRIEGDKKSVSSVSTSVENGALVISGTNHSPVTVYVTAGELCLIQVEGSGKISGSQLISADMLLLKVVGTGSIKVDVRTLSLGMIVRGKGKIYVEGTTCDSYTKVSGSGQVWSMNLDAYRNSLEANLDNVTAREEQPRKTKRHVLKLHE